MFFKSRQDLQFLINFEQIVYFYCFSMIYFEKIQISMISFWNLYYNVFSCILFGLGMIKFLRRLFSCWNTASSISRSKFSNPVIFWVAFSLICERMLEQSVSATSRYSLTIWAVVIASFHLWIWFMENLKKCGLNYFVRKLTHTEVQTKHLNCTDFSIH